MKHLVVSRSVFPALIGLVLLLGCAQPTPVPPTTAPTMDPGPIQTAAAATVAAEIAKNLTATAAIVATQTAEQVARDLTATAVAAPIQTATAASATTQAIQNLTATAAAIPTATPIPTPTDVPSPTATHTAEPTAKPQPTSPPATRVPPTVAPAAGYEIIPEPKGYEPWGRPVRGCGAFDNRQAVRKYNINITLKNNSAQAIDSWYPDFYTNTGANAIITCFYVYGGGFPLVPPGEARTVTFAVFVENDQYVALMVMDIAGDKVRRCFSPEGTVIACP